MENTIRELLQKASEEQDLDLISLVNDLMYHLETTCNIPSNWREIAEVMAAEFSDNQWVVKNCDMLWDFIEED